MLIASLRNNMIQAASMPYLFVCNMSIFSMMAAAILSSCIESRSSVAPLTRIQRLEMPRTSGLSAQAIGHPHTSIPISHGDDVISVTSRKPGWSNFSISRTNPGRSIRGLQPAAVFYAYVSHVQAYRYRNTVLQTSILKQSDSILCQRRDLPGIAPLILCRPALYIF